MPRKKRDIRRDYRKAGYDERPGKGDHTIFTHPLVDEPFSVDDRDGADAKPYFEKNLERARRKLAKAKKWSKQ